MKKKWKWAVKIVNREQEQLGFKPSYHLSIFDTKTEAMKYKRKHKGDQLIRVEVVPGMDVTYLIGPEK